MAKIKPTLTFKSVAIAIVTISGVVGAIYGVLAFIDSRIENFVRQEQFIKKIASHVRPYVIFDAKESILADGGAMQYIENIDTVFNGDKELTEIIVTPKVHLPIAPTLESLGEVFAITSKRGKKFQWIYEMGSIDCLLLESSAEHRGINRFRIEIIK